MYVYAYTFTQQERPSLSACGSRAVAPHLRRRAPPWRGEKYEDVVNTMQYYIGGGGEGHAKLH